MSTSGTSSTGSLLSGQLTNYNGAIQMLGNSGFDTNGLMQAELGMLQAQQIPYLQEKQDLETQKSSWNELSSTLSTLSSAATDLENLNIAAKSVTNPDTTTLGVTASGSALNGTHTISIQQLAKAQRIMSDKVGDATVPLGYSGTVQVDGQNLTISSSMSLNDIANSINTGSYNTNAAVINGYLVLTSQQTGLKNTMSFADATGGSSTQSSDVNSVWADISGTPASGTNTYQISVGQIATAQSVASSIQNDAKAALGYSGTFTLNGQDFTVSNTDSLSSLVSMINANTSVGVTASIDTTNRLILTDSKTGAANTISLTDSTTPSTLSDGTTPTAASLFQSIGLTDATGAFSNQIQASQDAQYTINGTSYTSDTNQDSTNIQGVTLNLKQAVSSSSPVTITINGGNAQILQGLGILNSSGAVKNQTQTAQDAQYTIDGVPITSSSNQDSTNLQGVTLNLLKATTSDMDIVIKNNTDDIKTKVQAFVNKFNAAISDLNNLTGKGGVLQGQALATEAKMKLDMALMNTVGGNSLYFSQLGIQIDGKAKDGSISFDSTKLDDQLSQNLDGILKFLGGANGIGGQFAQLLTSTTESIGNATQSLSDREADVDKTLQNMNDQYNEQQQMLLTKYSGFETMMSQLNGQSQYMTAELQSLGSSSSSSK